MEPLKTWIKKEEEKVSDLLSNDPQPQAETAQSTESPVTDSTATPSLPQPEAPTEGELSAEQQAAKDRLIKAAQELGAASEAALNAGLDVMAELQGEGVGGGPLPPAGQLAGPGDAAATALGHVPEGQLPPV